ncbi:uncharacterized protein LOC117291298 [Asterias rubens]|uniref:uncharacterized protein LOC117291298 n=1 Tax=Asterias rubens TaxID=7604 RepID=UPI0014555C07|nr:uncharacterized protein LOC117291298 [Asterias rubens]
MVIFLSNSFSSLDCTSDDIPSDELGSPIATSSPNPADRAKPVKNSSQHRKIKTLVINCDGLCNKLPQLESLIDHHKADVIVGTESHLKNAIFTSETTPPGFVTYQRDRIQGKKGGVCIMVKDDLIASECNIITTEAELIWVELHIKGYKRLIIGSFYRPPNSPPANIQHLSDSLASIQSKFKNAILIVGGDFNLADIDWTNRSVRPYAVESAKCSPLLDVCNDFFLDQLVKEPTRISEAAQNILDLVLSTHPNYIEKCKVVPGISDHEVVLFTLNLKPKLNKKVPRKVYLYGKANMENLRADMTNFQDSFLNSDPDSRNVQTNWNMFKEKISELMEKHIPSRTSCASHKNPWITREVRRMSKKKQSLYKKARLSNNPKDWDSFKVHQKATQKKQRKNFWAFQNNMFDEKDKSNKAFWKFIKSKK